MAAATAPGTAGRSLLGKVAVSLEARARARRGTSRLAAFIADHAATVAALGLVDAGLWHWSSIAGYVGAGVCVAVAEFKVRG